LNTPIKIADDVYRLIVPQPVHQANNVYLIIDEKLTLIDAGHCASVSQTLLNNSLQSLGYKWEDINQIVYTHPHMDHMGGGIYLTDCPLIHQVGCGGNIKEVWDYGHYFNLWCNMDRYFASKYPEIASLIKEEQVKNYINVDYPAEGIVRIDRSVSGDDIILLGRKSLQVIFTPGHSPYHLSLYEPESKLLFSGDFLLSTLPALTKLAGGNAKIYRETLLYLREMLNAKELEISLVLPGHGPVLSNVWKAIDVSLGTLEKYRQRVLNSLAGGSKGIKEIMHDFYNGRESKFFLGMTLGMVDNLLDWLIHDGLVGRVWSGERNLFYLKQRGL